MKNFSAWLCLPNAFPAMSFACPQAVLAISMNELVLLFNGTDQGQHQSGCVDKVVGADLLAAGMHLLHAAG
jgi:hypothetical protein